MPRRRIAVTGLGTVTALGADLSSSWRRLAGGETGIGGIDTWDASSYRTAVAGVASAFDDEAFPAPDRCLRLALAAAAEALSDAGLGAEDFPERDRCAVAVGTSLGGMISLQEYHRELLSTGRRRGGKLLLYPLHLVADLLARSFDLRGPRLVISTACTASTLILARGLDELRSGRVDFVLAGGVDPLAEFSFAGFNAMQNTSAQPCAPFSLPVGLNIGEGAGFLILEPLARAQARGARIYCEFSGRAMNGDAYHATSGDPTGESQARLLRMALADAGALPEEVDWVNAHGTGTSGNDQAETRAVHLAFGEKAKSLPVSSLKGALGHTLGAAGGVEAVFTAKAISEGVIPPTANFTTPREGCDLDYVPNRARAQKVAVAVSENYAFGGNNCALVFTETQRQAKAAARSRRRVAVTGLGVVSPLGCNLDDFSRALGEGYVGIHPYSRHPGGCRSRLAGELVDFDPSRLTSAKTRRMDRLGGIAMAACEQAFVHAGHRRGDVQSERFGIVLGTALGPVGSCEMFHRPVALGEPQKAPPAVFPNTVFNAAAGQVAMHLRLKGANMVSVLGQAAGLDAIIQAADLIAEGDADFMLAGGMEELEPCVFAGLAAARVVSPFLGKGGSEGARPFAEDANGPVAGEGGGILALEAWDAALARGATPLAEILGFGCSGDIGVRGQRDPSGAGVASAIRKALEMAGVEAGDVDMILAGAAGQPVMDEAETRAIASVFQDGIQVFPLNALWGFSAAGGGLAAVAAAQVLSADVLPKTPDYGYHPSYPRLSPASREREPRLILVNALSLGGANVSVLFGVHA